jgi:hypothetical protein
MQRLWRTPTAARRECYGRRVVIHPDQILKSVDSGREVEVSKIQ